MAIPQKVPQAILKPLRIRLATACRFKAFPLDPKTMKNKGCKTPKKYGLLPLIKKSRFFRPPCFNRWFDIESKEKRPKTFWGRTVVDALHRCLAPLVEFENT